ncbi:uncharacterized protein LOC121386539 [Gigantopelta aegis]|uniref:uncharacterized protein LOC121386539 n=1 Tax=Gigantopelta aegis TaxID=1735272 RepID=UPI001B88DE8F|nr:uncharacterized protein LOC121386539 [Gigantopelta aegis]XP_041373410.1 uncharacterized protein LOC121386539 [Gigantopelta aegis]XP_041373411.1 uncharacterized protein LOC121386539 [Gigantopelta aegis]
MHPNLQQECVPLLKIVVWVGVFGNCLAVSLLLRKRQLPSAACIILLSILDCVILVKLFLRLQNQFPPTRELCTLMVISSDQSSVCKMAALIMERLLLQSSVDRTVSEPRVGKIPGKWMPLFITVCALSPVVLLVYVSQSLELGSEWRLLLKILEILLLLVVPLAGMAYLVISIRRFLKKMVQATSGYLITQSVLDNDFKADRQFTTYLISIAMVSFVTYPIYATVIVADYMFPGLSGHAIGIVTSLTIIVQCGVNVCLQLVHTNPLPCSSSGSGFFLKIKAKIRPVGDLKVAE